MEIKPNPPSFLDLLNEGYEEEEKAFKYRGVDEYRHNPSSATMIGDDGKVVGACLRQLYYRATGEPVSDKKELTNKLQAGFGNGIHDFLTERLQKSDKIKLVPEVPGKVIVDPLTREISFRLDGLVTYLGELGCLEIKTQQSYGLQRMVKEGGPKKSDILQVLCYFGTNENIRWASLLYVARDSAYRAEYHIYKDLKSDKFMIKGITPVQKEKPIDGLTFDAVLKRWKELEGHVDRRELPKRDYQVVFKADGTVTDKRTKNGVDYKSDFQCNYCSYQLTCWSGIGAYEDSKNPQFER